MRIVLRIIAVGIWIAVIGTLGIVWRIWHFDHFVSLMATRSFGILTVVGWGITLTAGAFGATQLWRLRESGRKMALLLFGYGVFYYIAGWLSVRQAGRLAHPAWSAMALYAALVFLLLSPAARSTCHSDPPDQTAAVR